MTFGEKLARARREYNYTQEQLAEILEVSRQTVSKWESDIAYPETDRLIKLSKIFDCSVDYFLNDEIAEKKSVSANENESLWIKFKKQFRERKSTKMIFGMPLYHIGRDARGFFALGFRARGIFSVGLLSLGIVSLGLLSLGLISFGLIALGIISLGTFALGLISIGTVAIGLFAAGAISIGIVSFGALSVGYFSSGALAIGKYIAVGDHARGMIAIGLSEASGSVYSHIGNTKTADMAFVKNWLNDNIPETLRWAKEIFKLYLW